MMIPLACRGRTQEADRRVASVDTDSKVRLRGAEGTVKEHKTCRVRSGPGEHCSLLVVVTDGTIVFLVHNRIDYV